MDKEWKAIKRYVSYAYPTVEDLRAHMEYMTKTCGYVVNEFDEQYLYDTK